MIRLILLNLLSVSLLAQVTSIPGNFLVRPRDYTLANIPPFGVPNRTIYITDCESSSACFVGGGATTWLYRDTGVAWVPAHPTGGGGGGGITSLNSQTGSAQIFANDTNVTISSAGNIHSIVWSGFLSVARGGTGVGTLTGVVKGNGTSAFSVVSGSASDCVLVNGTSQPCDASYRASAVIDVAAVPDGTCKLDTTAVTVTGAALGGRPTVGASYQPPEGVSMIAKVTGPNSMKIEICNWSGASYDPASATYFFGVTQ